MVLEETETRNWCAGEGQQQFNRQTDITDELQLVRRLLGLSRGEVLLLDAGK
jgi:hypothetical protein